MKLKLTLAVAGLIALAIPFVAAAGSTTDRATGGGQILVGTRGGAGDTIAFTAHDRTRNPGQVQYIDRSATGQERYHGTVRCVEVTGNTALIAGVWTKQGAGNFNLYVEDNGEGANALESDAIFIDEMADDPTCDFDEPDDQDQLALARGNVQVYDYTGP